MWNWFKDISIKTPLPPPGKLTCSLTIFDKWYNPFNYKNLKISEYSSKEDLANALLSSGSIPWFFNLGIYFSYRNMRTMDGGISDDLPIFTDNVRPQLLCKWNKNLLPDKFNSRFKLIKSIYIKPEEMIDFIKYGIDTICELVENPELKGKCFEIL